MLRADEDRVIVVWWRPARVIVAWWRGGVVAWWRGGVVTLDEPPERVERFAVRFSRSVRMVPRAAVTDCEQVPS
ncbi:hypothetical protein IU479_17215 [Nocardia abscessus]|uniref:hypothetical protein n=1 Tax=Nocardia TaxID=1817 RepID=UPI001893A5C5|nr:MULTISPECIES: hypothetical protein [Nocardia]MBF6219847.1 hypothetical protein [Nocardia abscessus]MDE1668215.1 hypothetical protein [Nocardia gipuzkoensis]